MIFLYLVYLIAVVGWLRFLWLRSLRTAEDRQYTWQKVSQFALYVPLGLQAAFLFFFAVLQLLPLAGDTAELLDKLILKGGRKEYPEFEGLRILFSGCGVILISYLLNQAAAKITDTALNLVTKLFLFAGQYFLLKNTVLQIGQSLGFYPTGKILFSLTGSRLFLISLVLAIFFSFSSGKNGEKISTSRYPALVARMLLFYCLLILLLSLPRFYFDLVT